MWMWNWFKAQDSGTQVAISVLIVLGLAVVTYGTNDPLFRFVVNLYRGLYS